MFDTTTQTTWYIIYIYIFIYTLVQWNHISKEETLEKKGKGILYPRSHLPFWGVTLKSLCDSCLLSCYYKGQASWKSKCFQTYWLTVSEHYCHWNRRWNPSFSPLSLSLSRSANICTSTCYICICFSSKRGILKMISMCSVEFFAWWRSRIVWTSTQCCNGTQLCMQYYGDASQSI